MPLLLCLIPLLSACPPGEPGFGLVADAIPGGVLLAAWSDGDDALMVGGPLGSGPAVLARLRDGELCYEADVAERTLWWIHGPSPGVWWAVGEGGAVLHSRHGSRTREDVPTDMTLYGVWAASEDEVWAVGGTFETSPATGELWVRREGTWTLVSALDAAAFKVWEGWVVGQGGAWRIGEGDVLEEVDFAGERLVTVRGRGPDEDVWAVGGYGTPAVQRRAGGAWATVDATGLYQPLNGVWTAPGEPVWVAGMNGEAARLEDDGTWTTPELLLTPHDLHAVWKHGDEVLFVGGDMFADAADQRGTIVRYGTLEEGLEATPCD